MPVTAKLSRRFYEQLGDDVAGALVDWFNSVDAEYQSQLRHTNDLNYERFKSDLHRVQAELRSEIVAAVAHSEASVRRDFADLRKDFTDLRKEVGDLRKESADQRADLMKWMFVYWSGTVVTLGGLMIALR